MSNYLVLALVACILGGPIALIATMKIYLWLFKKFISYNINNPEERKQYQEKSKFNSIKLWLLSLPYLIIIAPIFEEITFRLPLILLFDSLTNAAWIGIGISSVLFGLVHIKNRKNVTKALTQEEIEQEKTSVLTSGNVYMDVIQTMLLGVLFGWVAIYTQNFGLAFAAHVAWNLLVILEITSLIIIIPILLITITLSISQIMWDKWICYRIIRKNKKERARRLRQQKIRQ